MSAGPDRGRGAPSQGASTALLQGRGTAPLQGDSGSPTLRVLLVLAFAGVALSLGSGGEDGVPDTGPVSVAAAR